MRDKGGDLVGMADKFDELKDKAEGMVGDGDEAKEKVDQAAEKADKLTKGKASGAVDKGAEATKEGIDKLTQ